MSRAGITAGRVLPMTALFALVLAGCAEPAGEAGQPPPGSAPATAQSAGESGAAATQAAAPVAGSDADADAPGVPAGAATPPAADAVAPAPAADGSTAADAAGADGAGNTDADVDQAIDTLLGDHKAYRDVFERVQAAVKSGDKPGLAALVRYPLKVQTGGKPRTIRNADEFVASWDALVTPEVVRVVSEQRYRDLFVNWQGLMLGDGQVWINGVCRDKACKTVDIGVTALQQGPQ